MIVHCSLWKFKEGTPQSVVEEAVREWRALLGGVPSIRRIEVGPDLGDWPENYDIAALVYFDSAKGYEEYRDDPVHLEFGYKYLVPHVEDLHMRAAVQFELPAAEGSAHG
ncbi:Dabb family protein [Streptomyces sp. NPDC058678]|uniref:Dabb family protein n=1 Tax=Streptomyces sp. NPDC058678 TaxID=3346595 RepID=UPI003656346A